MKVFFEEWKKKEKIVNHQKQCFKENKKNHSACPLEYKLHNAEIWPELVTDSFQHLQHCLGHKWFSIIHYWMN